MQADPVGQPGVDPGLRVVEAAAGGGGQPLGQPADREVVREADSGALEPLAAVDPDGVRRVDQDVGDALLADLLPPAPALRLAA